jgi:hypothetical protein
VILKTVPKAGYEYTLEKIDQREQKKPQQKFMRLVEQFLELQ